VLSCVDPASMAATNVPLYDAETQAWTEIAKKHLGSANAGDGRRDCDDRIGSDAYCRKDDGNDSGGVCSVSSADARRWMMRRRWTLSLNFLAYCCLTVA
jgi:hypothetical protein